MSEDSPRRTSFLRWVLPALLLAAHGALALEAARRLSPGWDEIVYPAAGVAQWRSGAVEINAAASFLPKLFYALPLLALNPALPLEHPSWKNKEAFRFGYQFTFRNRVPAQKLIFWGRVPAVLFSLLAGALLFFWLRSVWGGAGAALGLFAYAATPILLSRASLALLEMPLYFFTLLSLALYDRWRRAGRPWALYAGGAAAGLALACKLTAAPLLAAVFVMECLVQPAGKPFVKRLLHGAAFISAALLTVILVYLPWRGGLASLWETLSFASNLGGYNYYWAGRPLIGAPSPISWAAFLVKAPPFLWALALLGAARWFASRRERTLWLLAVIFTGMHLVVTVLVARDALSTVQMSSLYLGLAVLSAGALWDWPKTGRPLGFLAALLAAAALGDTAAAYPNTSAYFSPFVGGPRQGYRWLSDSDQDWGQSLPALARYWENEGRPPLLLCYSGAADPRAWGLRFQDLVSPSLVTLEGRDDLIALEEERILLAVGTKVIQSEPRMFGWLGENMSPLAMPDPCFFIYDVSREPEAFRWMGHIYLRLHRPAKARWAFLRAQRLEPGHPEDARALSQLERHLGEAK